MAHSHSPLLMTLSLLIAIIAAHATLVLLGRAHHARSYRERWLLLAGIVFGTGVWSMHFTAMLAYRIPTPVSYDPLQTSLSVVWVWFFAGAGFMVAALKSFPGRIPCAALLMGLGIIGMHYVGMEAMLFQGHLTYATWSILAAAGLAVAASLGALTVAANACTGGGKQRCWWAALAIGSALTGVHYVAMWGTGTGLDASLPAVTAGFSTTALAVAVTMVTSVLVLTVLLLAKFDESRHHSLQLSESLEELRTREWLMTRNGDLLVFRMDVEGNILSMDRVAWARVGAREGNSLYELVDPAQRDALRVQWREALRQGQFSAHIQFCVDAEYQPAVIEAAVVNGEHGACWQVLLRLQSQGEFSLDPESGLPNRLAALRWSANEPGVAVRLSIPVLDSLSQLLAPQLYRRLLINLVQALQTLVPKSSLALLARLEITEFLLVVVTSEDEVPALLKRLHRILELPIVVEGRPWHLHGQMGIAEVLPGSGGDELLRITAAALRRAQSENSSQHFYDWSLDAQWREQILMEQELRGALRGEQFRLVYQPQLDLRSNRVTRVEALLRWDSPSRGAVSPTTFIPVLEATGAIHETGQWVVAQALTQLAQWRRLPHLSELSVAINISPLQLFSDGLRRCLEEHRLRLGLPAAAIELEVTEGVAMDRSGDNLARLTGLREIGYGLAIDDFGTGYSSLAYLRELPVDTLKIDRAFVSVLGQDELAAELLRLLIRMGQVLGHEVVAEGVETQQQLALLREMGVHSVQGFGIARPMAPEQLSEFAQRYWQGMTAQSRG